MAASESKSEVAVLSTTDYELISEFGTGYEFTGISVKNYTDGDVWLAFRDTSFPDMIVKQDTDVVLEHLIDQTPIFVKNGTGAGGTVLIKLWQELV